MQANSRSRAESWASLSQEARLDRAFADYVARRDRATPGLSHRWTPSLRAAKWASFADECRSLRAAANIPDIFSGALGTVDIDLDFLSPRLPLGYLALAKLLLEMLDVPRLLAIGGIRGTGKTALVVGLLKKFCDLGRSGIYVTAAEYFHGLSSSDWNAKEAYRAKFLEADLLAMDEVQVRDDNKGWQDNELTTLIDHRHRSGASTVLLSNLEPTALKANLGDSIWRRLIETGGPPIETNWPRLEEWARQVRGASQAENPKARS